MIGYFPGTQTWGATSLPNVGLSGNLDYCSFVAGDVDGEAQDEILALTTDHPRSLIGWDWQPGPIDAWFPLPDLPLPLSDLGGLDPSPNLPSYRLLRIISSNGSPQVWVFTSAGLSFYEFSSQLQSWSQPGLDTELGLNGPPMPDSQFYTPFELADLDGDGVAELALFFGPGLWVFHYDPATQTWDPPRPYTYAMGPPTPGSVNEAQMVNEILCGDIDGDGKVELLIRTSAGLFGFHWTGVGAWCCSGRESVRCDPGEKWLDRSGGEYAAPELSLGA